MTYKDPHRDGRASVVAVLVFVLVIGAAGVLTRVALDGSNEDRPRDTPLLGALADAGDTYDPERAGEDLPPGYRQLLRRDAILPVYDPQFIRTVANDSWSDQTLVIGVEIDGESKAYPVSWLNRREMVIDRLAGIPILVTW